LDTQHLHTSSQACPFGPGPRLYRENHGVLALPFRGQITGGKAPAIREIRAQVRVSIRKFVQQLFHEPLEGPGVLSSGHLGPVELLKQNPINPLTPGIARLQPSQSLIEVGQKGTTLGPWLNQGWRQVKH
jgi:hypothetical protein